MERFLNARPGREGCYMIINRILISWHDLPHVTRPSRIPCRAGHPEMRKDCIPHSWTDLSGSEFACPFARLSQRSINMTVPAELASDGPVDLLPLALSRPNEALERARRVLAGDPGPLAASVARQAIGTVLREYGDIDAALVELRIARRLARHAGSDEREADVLGTLGVALIFAGRSVSGRNALNAAVQQSTGHLQTRMVFRRGAALLILGRHDEALEDLNTAIVAMRAADDQLWEARALQERAVSYLSSGWARRAIADLRRAEELFANNGQELESVEVTVNRGLVALRLGDLPDALSCFDEAAERLQRLGTSEPDLSIHRCAALTAAGLATDAMQEADAAIEQLDRIHGLPTKRAELLLTAATSALAAGQPAAALDRATEARRLFDRQGRRWWRAHAQLVQVNAGVEAGPATAALLRDAGRCARALAHLSSPHQPLAELAVGRIALALGRTAVANQHLAAAAAGRRHGSALSRAVAWRAEALRAEAVGDRRRLMYACRRGLDVIDEYRSMLGSSELRAHTTAHGAELANLGLRHALRLGRPGSCWPGASGGGRSRWPCLPYIRPPTRSCRPTWPRCETSAAGLRGRTAWGCEPLPSSTNASGWNARFGPGRFAPRAPAGTAPHVSEESTFPACWMRSATTGCSSWSTSKASCTSWCAATARYAGSRSAGPNWPRVRSGSPGSCLDAWPTVRLCPRPRRCTPG